MENEIINFSYDREFLMKIFDKLNFIKDECKKNKLCETCKFCKDNNDIPGCPNGYHFHYTQPLPRDWVIPTRKKYRTQIEQRVNIRSEG